jgi:Ni/Fe-hydrogenase b-type cytochrome subunit
MSQTRKVHPLIIRITHWVNFLALIFMVTSGIRIYNASPLFPFALPPLLEYGGLAYARQWHFAMMWVFVVNGLIWVLYNIASRHGRETTVFRKEDVKGVLPMIRYYLRIEKEHPPAKKYNPLQKLAYTSMSFVALLAILSGLVLYWPVQFQWLTTLFFGYDVARYIHFAAMSMIVIFFLGHLVMVAIAGWKNFASMITGGKQEENPTVAAGFNLRGGGGTMFRVKTAASSIDGNGLRPPHAG